MDYTEFSLHLMPHDLSSPPSNAFTFACFLVCCVWIATLHANRQQLPIDAHLIFRHGVGYEIMALQHYSRRHLQQAVGRSKDGTQCIVTQVHVPYEVSFKGAAHSSAHPVIDHQGHHHRQNRSYAQLASPSANRLPRPDTSTRSLPHTSLPTSSGISLSIEVCTTVPIYLKSLWSVDADAIEALERHGLAARAANSEANHSHHDCERPSPLTNTSDTCALLNLLAPKCADETLFYAGPAIGARTRKVDVQIPIRTPYPADSNGLTASTNAGREHSDCAGVVMGSKRYLAAILIGPAAINVAGSLEGSHAYGGHESLSSHNMAGHSREPLGPAALPPLPRTGSRLAIRVSSKDISDGGDEDDIDGDGVTEPLNPGLPGDVNRSGATATDSGMYSSRQSLSSVPTIHGLLLLVSGSPMQPEVPSTGLVPGNGNEADRTILPAASLRAVRGGDAIVHCQPLPAAQPPSTTTNAHPPSQQARAVLTLSTETIAISDRVAYSLSEVYAANNGRDDDDAGATAAGAADAADADANECSVCWTNPAATILLPCRHMCMCTTCLAHVQKCPVCRTPIKAHLTLHDVAV